MTILLNHRASDEADCFLSHLLPSYDACLRGAASAKAGGKVRMGVDLIDPFSLP